MKRLIFYIISICFIIFFISLYRTIDIVNVYNNEENPYLADILKKYTPNLVKDFARETIFVFKKVDFLENELKKKQDIIYNNQIEIKKLKTNLSYFHEDFDYNLIDQFIFKKNFSKQLKFGEVNVNLNTFKLPILTHLGPRGYFSIDNQNLYLISGTGLLLYSKFEDLEKNNYIFKKIQTNFIDIASKKFIDEKTDTIKGLLIDKDKIYLSYLENKINCVSPSVLVGNLNLKKITFKKFFDSDLCVEYGNQTGGVLSKFIDNKIIMTIGSFATEFNQDDTHPQNINSLVGKIISIDKDTGIHKILSTGHRNAQGVFYDDVNHLIINAEHGPKGGDEININTSPDDKIKNFGWPISSYGEHYSGKNKWWSKYTREEIYEMAPLYKSHEDYNFVEPQKYFVPSIGISQIIKNEKFIKINNKIIFYVGAMGFDVEEGDMSLHQIIYNKNYEEEEHNIIKIGERIRDIIYAEKLNKIYLFLETSGSIGELSLQ